MIGGSLKNAALILTSSALSAALALGAYALYASKNSDKRQCAGAACGEEPAHAGLAAAADARSGDLADEIGVVDAIEFRTGLVDAPDAATEPAPHAEVIQPAAKILSFANGHGRSMLETVDAPVSAINLETDLELAASAAAPAADLVELPVMSAHIEESTADAFARIDAPAQQDAADPQ